MFVRQKRNQSGSISVQVIDRSDGYRVVKTIGTARDPVDVARLVELGKLFIARQSGQYDLFPDNQHDNAVILDFVQTLGNASVRTVGPELIFGRLFDEIGFDAIPEPLFRDIVIARLVYPTSKLKTVDYLYRYQGKAVSPDSIYLFLDRLNARYADQAQRIAYRHSFQILQTINVVFYDMTSLYFEAEDEDDLRRIGFSKDGKFQNPQIMLGLLVGRGGYPIGYDIFEGNTFEGKTLLPVLERIARQYDFGKPIVIADAAMLSNDNLDALDRQEYPFIVAARIRNESQAMQETILRRCTGLQSGQNVEIDEAKIEQAARWDGLKGYLTNTDLSADDVIENYGQLWQIERAFRISKTDLRIRPMYHRRRRRIEAHVLVAFVAYTIYKELERRLAAAGLPISPARAAELTQTMYELTFRLPNAPDDRRQLLAMDPEQSLLYDIFR